MVEAQFINSTADRAPTPIALLDFEFHSRQNYSSALCIGPGRLNEVFLTLDCQRTELEYGPMLVSLLPGVREMKDAVVRPDSRADLLVDAYALRWTPMKFEGLRRLVKPAVLGESVEWGSRGPVHNLRVRARCRFWMIVPLVDEHSTAILDFIAIRRIGTERHKDYGVISAQAKVHPLLEACAFATRHLNVGNYIVTHGVSHNTKLLGMLFRIFRLPSLLRLAEFSVLVRGLSILFAALRP